MNNFQKIENFRKNFKKTKNFQNKFETSKNLDLFFLLYHNTHEIGECVSSQPVKSRLSGSQTLGLVFFLDPCQNYGQKSALCYVRKGAQ